ncbi:hypothetical protein BDB00DRAFT_826804 [Zychaea mexicana]|uniref:uncharacterized protein n=1 Tax=Zychaea mexicana TaxID=64656 RepID=UPI0022FE3F37|nr:uncharacterized protein BDB00DRAFT_826804 [Zychaea mexicana]KAI9492700.1 hypothetical protein BDB00DRAFT_826804 [Zychaea mexicana]
MASDPSNLPRSLPPPLPQTQPKPPCNAATGKAATSTRYTELARQSPNVTSTKPRQPPPPSPLQPQPSSSPSSSNQKTTEKAARKTPKDKMFKLKRQVASIAICLATQVATQPNKYRCPYERCNYAADYCSLVYLHIQTDHFPDLPVLLYADQLQKPNCVPKDVPPDEYIVLDLDEKHRSGARAPLPPQRPRMLQPPLPSSVTTAPRPSVTNTRVKEGTDGKQEIDELFQCPYKGCRYGALTCDDGLSHIQQQHFKNLSRTTLHYANAFFVNKWGRKIACDSSSLDFLEEGDDFFVIYSDVPKGSKPPRAWCPYSHCRRNFNTPSKLQAHIRLQHDRSFRIPQPDHPESIVTVLRNNSGRQIYLDGKSCAFMKLRIFSQVYQESEKYLKIELFICIS